MQKHVIGWTVAAAIVFFFVGSWYRGNSDKKKIEALGTTGTPADALKAIA